MSGAEIPIIISAVGGITQLVGLGTSIAGGVKQAEGLVKGAELEAEALKRKAEFEQALKNEQANEMLAREEINRKILERQIPQMQGEYATAFAASGRLGGIGGMVRIKREMEEAITLKRREVEYSARMIRRGAEIDRTLAFEAGNRIREAAQAGYSSTILGTIGKGIAGVGSIGADVATYYNLNRGPSDIKSLYDGGYAGAGGGGTSLLSPRTQHNVMLPGF